MRMGRFLFGASAVAIGAASLVLHDQLISMWNFPGAQIFLYVTSVAQLLGGLAMLLPTTAKRGSLLLTIVYAVIALTFVPPIFREPTVYASWGDVFYALALLAGAAAVYGLDSLATTMWGLCNLSFAIEQIEFFARTASLVPPWMPGGGNFWTVVTTVALAVAGIAILTRRQAQLASRLLTILFLAFGVTIWIPMLIARPDSFGNWSEGLETFAIAGTAWIVADILAPREPERR